MTVALYSVSALLTALLVVSAGLKLSGKADTVASYARVGVSAHQLPPLAAVLLAGAAGLVMGLFWTPLGLAAAGALAVYFALALIAHATHHDLSHAGTPAILLLLAIASTVLFADQL